MVEKSTPNCLSKSILSTPAIMITPTVAKITDKILRKVIFSFKSHTAKININAGVAEVTTEPICAEEYIVPYS